MKFILDFSPGESGPTGGRLRHARKIDPPLRCFEHTRSILEFQGESVATIDEHLAGQLPRRLYGPAGSPLIQAAISSAAGESTTFRARGGILYRSDWIMRTCSIERARSPGATTSGWSMPRLSETVRAPTILRSCGGVSKRASNAAGML